MPESSNRPQAAPDDMATRIRPLPPKMALRGVSGSCFGKVVPLAGRITVGRGADCDLVLDEPEISRHHALIEVTPTGIVLKDLGSANGTFVNGSWVRNAELKLGDQIGFDRGRFLVESLTAALGPQPGTLASTRDDSAPVDDGTSSRWPLLALGLLVLVAAGVLVWYLSQG